MRQATPKTKIDTKEEFKLSNEYINKKNLLSKINTLKNTGKNSTWKKVFGEYINKKNSSNIPNTKSIIRKILNSKKLPIIIILAFESILFMIILCDHEEILNNSEN
ncbi:hypothetical protein RIR_jg1327.t1 [Rhizophagus irregularis DAOM 181602=DAOM 197198]|nr:hypothetical protein RIR_jg1327.t1 [Rhizophagus irregularis DAOM 181602=DAOM 197198]